MSDCRGCANWLIATYELVTFAMNFVRLYMRLKPLFARQNRCGQRLARRMFPSVKVIVEGAPDGDAGSQQRSGTWSGNPTVSSAQSGIAPQSSIPS